MKFIYILLLICSSIIASSQTKQDTLEIKKYYTWNDTTKLWKYTGCITLIGNESFQRSILTNVVHDTIEIIQRDEFKTKGRLDSLIDYQSGYKFISKHVSENSTREINYRLDKETNLYKLIYDAETIKLGCFNNDVKVYVNNIQRHNCGKVMRIKRFEFVNNNLIKKETYKRFHLKGYKEISLIFCDDNCKLNSKYFSRIQGNDTTYNCVTKYYYVDTLLTKIHADIFTKSKKKKFLSEDETIITYENGLKVTETHSQKIDPFVPELRINNANFYKYDSKNRIIEITTKSYSYNKNELTNSTKIETVYKK